MSSPAWSRRTFLSVGARGAAAAGALAAFFKTPRPFGDCLAAAAAGNALAGLVERAPVARYWLSGADALCASCHDVSPGGVASPHGTDVVRCTLCAHRCLLSPGERGRCRARLNVAGRLKTLVYGRPITLHVDPIEKKPFYHFLPGSAAFSLATSGCPLRCKFCQNWEISQARPEDYDAAPTPADAVADQARRRGATILAYTYNEPVVFLEYLADIARAGRARGLRSVMVSCGYGTHAPTAELCDVLDAVKIDLKGFSPEFYRTVAGAELSAVLRTVVQVHKSARHLELVNLVVPTLNDSDAMLQGLARWVKNELGADVPLHFTRFHPDYQLQNLPPTPVATLERARDIARAHGLRYVYVGNVPGHAGNHTYCPRCAKAVVTRAGFFVSALHVKAGRCAFCGERLAGVWS